MLAFIQVAPRLSICSLCPKPAYAVLIENQRPYCESHIQKIYKCGGCGIRHMDVEASGIYHCPNPYCGVTGAAWFRTKLESCQTKGDRHNIDQTDWFLAARRYLQENQELRDHIAADCRPERNPFSKGAEDAIRVLLTTDRLKDERSRWDEEAARVLA